MNRFTITLSGAAVLIALAGWGLLYSFPSRPDASSEKVAVAPANASSESSAAAPQQVAADATSAVLAPTKPINQSSSVSSHPAPASPASAFTSTYTSLDSRRDTATEIRPDRSRVRDRSSIAAPASRREAPEVAWIQRRDGRLLALPGGVPLPAAGLDTDQEPGTPGAEVLDRLVENFLDEGSASSATGDAKEGESNDPTVDWWAARARADELYRALYGFERADRFARDAYLELLN